MFFFGSNRYCDCFCDPVVLGGLLLLSVMYRSQRSFYGAAHSAPSGRLCAVKFNEHWIDVAVVACVPCDPLAAVLCVAGAAVVCVFVCVHARICVGSLCARVFKTLCSS